MSGHGGGGAPAKSAFERMIGRRTATEAPTPLSLGPDGAVSASSPPKRVGFATHGGGGASPRTSAGGGRGAATVRPKAGAFPSAPPPGFSLDESAFGDDNQTDYGPSSSAAASPATSSRHANSPRTFRSRGGGSSSGGGQRWPRPGRAGGGGRSFAGGGGFGDDDDDDFELQTGTWDEEAVEEVYGCDPSAAAYSSSHAGPSRLGAAALSPADGDGGSAGWPAHHYYYNDGGNGYGGRPPSRGASSVGGASSVDEDGFAIPPAGYASGGGGGGSRRDGGGGGKTRTRCRGISAAPAPLPTAAHATRSGNLAAPPPVLSGAFRAPAANSTTTASSSSAASIGRNKKLARKPSQVTQALQRRSRHDLAAQPRRRGRGDTSDDDDDDEGTTYTTEVFLYAPSPAARPTRAPIQIPGAFVLPLQAEVEDATELLFMEFELC